MAKATIIVLNFNGMPCIRETLNALLSQSHKDIEIILVDNQSRDGSPEMVEKEYPKVKVVRNTSNAGICSGYNLGIKHSTGEYIGTIANDMILDKDWTKNAIAVFEKDPKVGVVGSFVDYDQGYYRGEQVYGFYLDLMTNPYPIHQKHSGYAFGVNGTLLKRPLMGETPYDNSGLFFFADDVYIGWKALITGYESARGEGVKMRHIGRVAAKTVPDLVEFHAEKDRFLSPLIFYGTASLIKIFPILLTSMLLSIIFAIPKRRTHLRLKSYFWIAKNRARIMRERKNIQSQRKVPDRKIFQYITYKTPYPLGPFTPIAQKLLWLYCFILRIPAREMQKLNP